jgi:hypothetical protein
MAPPVDLCRYHRDRARHHELIFVVRLGRMAASSLRSSAS